jgi:hypothetical protein
MDSANTHGCAQNAGNGFDEFLNCIIQTTGDEAWAPFVNTEIKEQSRKWMGTHSPQKLKKCK